MKWLLLALLAMPVTAVADAYVAIPANTGMALYFPTVDSVQCYSAVVNSAPAIVSTNRCYQLFLPAVFVQGTLFMMNRPIDQLLKSCAFLNCELQPMPVD
jgi:hypothetical protein